MIRVEQLWFYQSGSRPLTKSFVINLPPSAAPGPNLHIARKSRTSVLKLPAGPSEMKVSWQVTGIRRDPWAQAKSTGH